MPATPPLPVRLIALCLLLSAARVQGETVAEDAAAAGCQACDHAPLAATQGAELDWHPLAAGTSSRTHCTGRYRQPRVHFADAALAPERQPLRISAGQVTGRPGGLSRLGGGVHLRQGNRQVWSQDARLDQRSRQAHFRGDVRLREPDLLILGDNARLNLAQESARLEEVRFVIHDSQLRGQAKSLEKRGDGRLVIHQGGYTRCEPGNDAWVLEGERIVLRPDDGLGSVRHARLRVGGVPVLYAPYLFFPIDDRRMSGLLTPELTVTDRNGFDYLQPYYFNLAPWMDDTLSLRYLEKRGVQLENEFRYRHRRGSLRLGTAWLESDDQADRDRWLLALDHQGNPAPGWQSHIDFTRVSDSNYFEDLSTQLAINRNEHVQQQGRLDYHTRGLHAGLLLQDYQVVDEATQEAHAMLPRLEMASDGHTRAAGLPLRWRQRLEFTRFARDPEGFAGLARAEGDRWHWEGRLSAPFNWSWGFLRPAFNLSHSRYHLKGQPANIPGDAKRTQPRYSLDAGLFFERPLAWGDRHYRQTLEPRLKLIEAPFRDQGELPRFDTDRLTFSFDQLFRDDRFSGVDRQGDARRLSLALTTRVLDEQGREHLSLSAGQMLHFRNRRVRLDPEAPPLTDERSQWAAQAQWQPTNHWQVSGDGLWEQNLQRVNKFNLGLGYRRDSDRRFNAEYRFTRGALEQLNLSAIWPLSPRWSLMGRWLADMDGGEPLDRILGLEYESCCWRVRTLYRSWIDESSDARHNRGLFLQLTLKGLGTAGTQALGEGSASAEDFLRAITGFEERERP